MKRTSNILLVYITAPDRRSSAKLAEALVREQLAACVNILGKIESVYRWKGKVERAREIALIAKTTTQRYSAFEKRVKSLHPYDCPCIVALPVKRGHAAFLDWIHDQIQPD